MDEILRYPVDRIATLLLIPSSSLSVTSLACAFLIAAGFLLWKGHNRRRAVPPLRALLRALFPRRQLLSASHRLDIAFVVLNTTILALIVGSAIVSYGTVSAAMTAGLVMVLGPSTPTLLPEPAIRVVLTVAMFLAYEFAYWLDHYLSHRIPILWEFHRVHHEAKVLTPLTVYRVHPIDSIIFYNILAATVGVTNALVLYGCGTVVSELSLYGMNVIVFCMLHLVIHLQHSHIWIAFTGRLGCVLMSPAHHQMHHSMNPKHFNTNLGGSLAIFDWLFGTLHIPAKSPESLTFGVEAAGADTTRPHSFFGALIQPFIRCCRQPAHRLGRPAMNREESPDHGLPPN